ncbi:hypothetical protein R6Q59_018436 [Mikania micrantha]
MAKLLIFLLLLLFPCNSVRSTKNLEVSWRQKQLFHSIHRAMKEYFSLKMTQLDSINPPTTPLPSPPTTNPVTTPPINTAPGIVTVPGTNPVTPPVTNPVNPPVTNPVTPPVTNPVNPPVTNPVNPSVPVTNPVTSPSTTQTASGRWCIAKNGASQMALQAALDYACGIGGADCATIQQGSSCYEPVTLQNHASYAFNSYYQKNPVSTSCDFGGAAALTNSNPSTGTCVYPSSSSSSSSSPTTQTPVTPTPVPTAPTTQAPVTPTPIPTSPTIQAPVNPTSLPTAPTTSSSGPTFPGTQYPPPAAPGLGLVSPDPTGLGAYGASPPLTNTASVSKCLQPLIGSLVAIASIIMFGL